MTIPFFRDGFALPVTQALLTLLNQEVANIGLNLERLTQLTFNFRSPTYSPEQGGAHPVEIRLIRGLDGWLFDYVTDFSYQGVGQDAELCKELDFNFLDDEHYLQGWGAQRPMSYSPCGRPTLLPTAGWRTSPLRSAGIRRCVMTNELPLSHFSRQWLGLVAAKAKLQPTRQGERWLLHLTPDSPPARTVTLQVRWSGVQWQLLSLTNVEDWRTMSQPVDEICVDPTRRCFWRCQAGPVLLSEQPRVLGSFLNDLQRTCIHHGYRVESDPLPQEGAQDA